MALLDEIRQQVNTACEAISLLVAQSRTVTRARTQTRPGNQSDFLCYTLESETGTAESILGGGARGPANELYGFAYVSKLRECCFAEYKNIKKVEMKQNIIIKSTYRRNG